MKNYYKVLNVKKSDKERVIKKKFILLITQHHPENMDNKPLDTPYLFTDYIEAYEIISNEKSRKVYEWLYNGEKQNSATYQTYKKYLDAVTKRAREKGEAYSLISLKKLKENYRSTNWWDITDIIQNIMP